MISPLPARVHLPSGRAVRLSDAAARRAPRSDDGPFAEALGALAAEGVLAGDDGAPLDVLALSVRDVHVLRALVTRAGCAREDPAEFTCENCGEPFEIAPSSVLEIGPFVDGELTDPELDAPFPFGEPLPIPRIALPASRATPGALRPRGAPRTTSPRGARHPASRPARAAPTPRFAETITFADRTGAEARALFQVADSLLSGRARSLRITPAIVVGMGIVALGPSRRAPVIAEALMGASNTAWAKVLSHWHEAAYPRRLFAVHRCEKCGARNDLDVPLARELDREQQPCPRAGRAARQPFPDLSVFEALVESAAARIYESRGVRNIDLFVDAGVPHCDEGGEPLLGSYLPGGVDEDTGIPRPPEIRLYYRTFQSEYDFDPDFDVEGEIRETIDHEVEHHLNHLSGVDPLDEEEHAAIDHEELRRVGARETARRSREQALSSVSGFARTTWPLWVAVLIAALITWWSRA